MKLTAYIDADILCYIAACSVDDEFDGEVVFMPDQACKHVDDLVEEWLDRLSVKKVYLCLSGDTNFRYDVDPYYKANRGKTKPPTLKPLKRLLAERNNSILIEGLEADDIIGMSTSAHEKNVAVSLDKDFYTIPGLLFNPKKMRSPERITEDAANLFWMRQVLTGDTTDNIKGLYRVGPVKAKKMLPVEAPLPDLWAEVVKHYERGGRTVDDAIQTARLTRILRYGDYDDGERRVRLWTPGLGAAPAGGDPDVQASDKATLSPDGEARADPGVSGIDARE